MGDPALHLWTDTPKGFFHVQGIPSQIPLGSNHLRIEW